jgi:hypothetical protein
MEVIYSTELHGVITPKTVPVVMTAARTSKPRRGLYLFFCGLLNSALSIASHGEMTDEFEGIWKEAVVVQSRLYPEICLEGLRNTTKILSENIQCFS